jgi:hypothetical protein
MANIELTTVTGTDLAATRGGFARVGGIYQAATRAAALAATIPADVAVIQTLAFAAAGDGGGGFYKELGSAPTLTTNPAYLHIGSRWFGLVLDGGSFNVLHFGWVPDYVRGGGSTDNYAAWLHVLAFSNALYPQFPRIIVPPGQYYFSQTLEIWGGTMRLSGFGSGREDQGQSTQFWFPRDVGGITLARHNTHLQGLASVDGIGGDGSIVEGIAVFSESDGIPQMAEINATYTATSTYPGYTGATGTGAGLRDGGDSSAGTVWASTASGGSITADLGSVQGIGGVRVAPIPASFDGWGTAYTTGALIETSPDGTTWTSQGTISGVTVGGLTINRVDVSARYVRVSRAGSYVALSEFRIFAHHVAGTGTDGFECRGRPVLRDVQAVGFARHGFHMHGDSGASDPARLGNANIWQLRDFNADSNGCSGVRAEGGDANVGTAAFGVCYNNGEWGFTDESLGSNWIGIESTTNGKTGKDTVAEYGGFDWTVIPGRLSLASTTQPGTNAGDGSPVWQKWGPTQGWSFARPWVSGKTWREGGASREGWALLCYTEGAQPPRHCTGFYCTLFGLQGAGHTEQSNGHIQGGRFAQNGYAANGNLTEAGLGGDDARGIIWYGKGSENNPTGKFYTLQTALRQLDAAGDYVVDVNGVAEILRWTGTNTTTTFGRTNPVPYASLPGRTFVYDWTAGGTNANELSFGNAAPTTGEWRRGDIRWNSNVTSGQPEGWRCIVSGTPGTWTAMANHP